MTRKRERERETYDEWVRVCRGREYTPRFLLDMPTQCLHTHVKEKEMLR